MTDERRKKIRAAIQLRYKEEVELPTQEWIDWQTQSRIDKKIELRRIACLSFHSSKSVKRREKRREKWRVASKAYLMASDYLDLMFTKDISKKYDVGVVETARLIRSVITPEQERSRWLKLRRIRDLRLFARHRKSNKIPKRKKERAKRDKVFGSFKSIADAARHHGIGMSAMYMRIRRSKIRGEVYHLEAA